VIARLTGTLVEKHMDHAVVDAGGVGYKVHLSLQTGAQLPPAGKPVTLRIHTHVREDALQLYGFVGEREEELFHLLITVSGVGPRLAINVLSGMPAEDLARAVGAGDLTTLTKIPGVGKKTAERLVVELKDKVKRMGPAHSPSARGTPESELASALINLGYKPVEAERAARAAVERSADKQDLASLIREALRSIA
jgi:Holliday junction DNA helicase RuvA